MMASQQGMINGCKLTILNFIFPLEFTQVKYFGYMSSLRVNWVTLHFFYQFMLYSFNLYSFASCTIFFFFLTFYFRLPPTKHLLQ
jgi:hypothetical protein